MRSLLAAAAAAFGLAVASAGAPLGVHTAIHGELGVAVSWSTTEPLLQSPTVRFGTASGALDQTTDSADGETKVYLDGATIHHHAVLRELSPGTEYFYQIQVSTESGRGSLEFERRSSDRHPAAEPSSHPRNCARKRGHRSRMAAAAPAGRTSYR